MSLFEHDQYSVELADTGDVAHMRGVMRLASPAAYEAIFAGVRARLDRGAPLTIDLRDVSFMNSSGIRALATLVLAAKASSAPLRIVASQSAVWQKKTMPSLRAIHSTLVVDLG
jgi:anti-anti-sigma factor